MADSALTLTIRAVDKATAPLRALAARIGKLTSPLRALTKDAGFVRLGKSFTGVGKAIGNVQSEAFALGTKLIAMGGAAAFGFYKIVRGAVDAGDELATMAQRTGLSVDAFAQLQFAAQLADIDQEKFNSSMDQFNKRLGQMKANSGPLLAFLNKVSPALAKQVKGAKDTGEAFALVTSAFAKVTDKGKRAALEDALFGKGGKGFGEFLGQGADKIMEAGDAFERAHGSVKKFADGSSEVDNALITTTMAFNGMRATIVTGLYPAILKISKAVTDFLSKNREGMQVWAEKTGKAITAWVDGGGIERLIVGMRELAAQIAAVVKWLGPMGTALVAVGVLVAPLVASLFSLGAILGKVAFALLGPVAAALGTFVTALGAGFTAMEALNLVLLMNPIGLVIAGVAALAAGAYLIYKNWEPIKTFFQELWETLKNVAKAMVGVQGTNGKGQAQFREVYDPSAPGGVRREQIAPKFDAVAAMPQQKQGASTVKVDFSNMPKGVKVTQDKTDTPIDLDLGWSNMVPQ